MKLSNDSLINEIAEHIKKITYNESSGHDWWHIYRVWKLSLKIAEKEGNVNLRVLQLAALLHDLDDWKLNEKSKELKNARKILKKFGVDKETTQKVLEIIKDISFRGTGKSVPSSKEGKIVQDADRLDAMGAIGIARCFATGGKLGRAIYDPDIHPKEFKSFEEYKKAKSTSINHFYEKLLKLKDLMNTPTAKEMAQERYRFMEEFLRRFFNEWNV